MVSAKTEEVKEYVKTVGNFEYTYRFCRDKGYLDGVWITRINPISEKNIERLEIPNTFDGKNVIRIGNEEDVDYGDYGTDNIFGINEKMNYKGRPWYPLKQVKKVSKIKNIVLPIYLREMTYTAFDYVQDGKTIYISAGLKQNVENLTKNRVSWKSIEVAPDNKWFKVKNQCLLSKSGEILYGYFGAKKKVKIPNGVKSIADRAFYCKDIEELFIPQSVSEIDSEAFLYLGNNTVAIKLSEKNKFLGLENNCIYNKKTGRLVAAYGENETINIPRSVMCLEGEIAYSGYKVNKIIVPDTIQKIEGWDWSTGMNYDDNLKVEFLSATPPEKLDNLPDAIISVPRGSKERYDKAILEKDMELRDYWHKDSVIKYEDYITPPNRVVIERPYIPYYKFLDAILYVTELQKHIWTI